VETVHGEERRFRAEQFLQPAGQRRLAGARRSGDADDETAAPGCAPEQFSGEMGDVRHGAGSRPDGGGAVSGPPKLGLRLPAGNRAGARM
jgi:hypothetical protein